MTLSDREPGDRAASRSVRRRIEEARERLFVPPPANEALAPVAQLRAHARFMDELLEGILEGVAGEVVGERGGLDGLAILATGGYGRLDLFPFSDVDLCVLHDGPLGGPREDLVRRTLQQLWDGGVRLSHAVRDLDSCRAAMEIDLATATALMESRLVAGEAGLFERFRSEVLIPWMRRDAERRLTERLAEIERRHRAHGSSPLVKEPDVKESMGGLRDYHCALWIERMLRLLGAIDDDPTFPWPTQGARLSQAAVVRAVATVSGARIALHRVHGRQHDQLDLASQLDVARWLGISDEGDELGVERFMRCTLRAAIELADLLEAAVEGYHRVMRRRGRSRPRREVAPGLVLVDDSLYPASADCFTGAEGALRAVDLFVVAQRLHVRPSGGALVAVRRALADGGLPLVRDPSVASRLTRILGGRGNVGETLRAMHRGGLLGAMIPEFGDLTALVRFDPYHRYTVDEHSLRAVEQIDLIERGEAGGGTPRAALDRIARPDLVKLALLLHDIGKARGHGHVERGRVLVPGILTRLGLPTEEARTVLFLVNEHLCLSDTLQKGDPSDPATLGRVAEVVQTPERLDMLYLVTRSDMAATSPAVLPRWQDALLARLYERCRAILSGQRQDLLEGGDELRQRILSSITDERSRRRAAEHLDLVSSRYLMEIDPGDVRLHLELIEKLSEDRPVVVEVACDDQFVSCWIAARDRPRLLSDICGAFAGARLDIVSADVMTRADGIAIDRLRAVAGERVPVTEGRFWEGIEAQVAAAGRGEVDLGVVLGRLREHFAGGQRRPRYRVTVHLDNRISPARTVIEASGNDRRGLLFEITRELAAREIEIVFARIATMQGKASDIFYVHDKGQQVAASQHAEIEAALATVLQG